MSEPTQEQIAQTQKRFDAFVKRAREKMLRDTLALIQELIDSTEADIVRQRQDGVYDEMLLKDFTFGINLINTALIKVAIKNSTELSSLDEACRQVQEALDDQLRRGCDDPECEVHKPGGLLEQVLTSDTPAETIKEILKSFDGKKPPLAS